MKKEDWDLLDRQTLGMVRLSLAKNVSYNIVNVKTTHELINVLPNMYEKHSATNRVFLIWQLVNLKMKEGGSLTDHVNEFNLIISIFDWIMKSRNYYYYHLFPIVSPVQ